MQVYLLEIDETSDRLRRNRQLRALRDSSVRIGRNSFVVEKGRRAKSLLGAIREQHELRRELKAVARDSSSVSVTCLSGPQRGLKL